MVIINPREVAAETLMQIAANEGYNNMALKKALRQNGAMSRKDKALVTELVNGTLRNINYIDYVINRFSNTKTKKLKPWLLAVMRMTVYQLVYMDKIPPSAACNEAVKLAKLRGYAKLSGFVNGVLRTIAREYGAIDLPDEKTEPVNYLSVKYSHPEWLLEKWISEYGFDFTRSLCEKNNTAPDVTLIVNKLRTDNDTFVKALEEKGVSYKRGNYYDYAFHVSKTSDLSEWNAFKDGLFHVQDESSATAVELIDPRPGERILDICAAPGGKTMLMAEKMNNEGLIEAGDIHVHKLELIKNAAERLGISIVNAVCRDAARLYEDRLNAFDKVLVDAPCTGLGLLSKKPDIRLKKSGEDIRIISELQRNILKNAALYVKKGGLLVYSTCTISREENEDNIKWFLESFKEFELAPLTGRISQKMDSPALDNGYIQLFPNIHDTDGFFIALMKRKVD